MKTKKILLTAISALMINQLNFIPAKAIIYNKNNPQYVTTDYNVTSSEINNIKKVKNSSDMYVNKSLNDEINAFGKSKITDFSSDLVSTKKNAYDGCYLVKTWNNVLTDEIPVDRSTKMLFYYLYGGCEEGHSQLANFDTNELNNAAYYTSDLNLDTRLQIISEINEEQNNLKAKYKRYISNMNEIENRDKVNATYFIDLENLLFDNVNANDWYKYNVTQLAKYIKNNCSYMSIGSTRQIESTNNNGVTVLESVENKSNDTLYQFFSDSKPVNIDDWYYAIGGSKGDVLAKVTRTSSTNYNIQLNYCLQDVYNWPGNRPFHLGDKIINALPDRLKYMSPKFTIYNFEESDLNKLNMIGYARSYRIFGSYLSDITFDTSSGKIESKKSYDACGADLSEYLSTISTKRTWNLSEY